jgi:C4-dicarboxylate transporter, DctQ subunit
MDQLMRRWEKVNDVLDKVLLIIASSVIAFIMICISMEAILRNTIGSTRGWMEEFPRLFVVIAVFLLMGPLVRKNLHINTDMVDVLVKNVRVKMVVAFIVELAMIAGGIIMLWAGIAGVQGYVQMGTISATEIELPIWTLYLVVPIGSAILTIEAIEMCLRTALSLSRLGKEPAK